jgi:hypothetical protein
MSDPRVTIDVGILLMELGNAQNDAVATYISDNTIDSMQALDSSAIT